MKYKYGLLFIIERKEGEKKKQTSLSVAETKKKSTLIDLCEQKGLQRKKKKEK